MPISGSRRGRGCSPRRSPWVNRPAGRSDRSPYPSAATRRSRRPPTTPGRVCAPPEEPGAAGADAEQPVRTRAPAPRIAAPTVVKRGKEVVFFMVISLPNERFVSYGIRVDTCGTIRLVSNMTCDTFIGHSKEIRREQPTIRPGARRGEQALRCHPRPHRRRPPSPAGRDPHAPGRKRLREEHARQDHGRRPPPGFRHRHIGRRPRQPADRPERPWTWGLRRCSRKSSPRGANRSSRMSGSGPTERSVAGWAAPSSDQ